MNSRGIYVGAVGMACPVGMSWPAACAAMRAGITRRWISPHRDEQGQEIVASYVRGGPLDGALRASRCRWLLDAAFRELSRRTRGEERQMPMFLAMTPPLALNGSLGANHASIPSALGISTSQIHTIEGPGAFSALAALREAVKYMEEGESCLLAAVDSLVGARELLRLSSAGRLLTPRNPDGVTPGEAAAVVLLTRNASGALAKVCGLGFGEEPALLDNDVPLRADGLVAAARLALEDAGLTLPEIDFRTSDAAGESFFFKEQALMVARLLRDRKATFPLWLPAKSLGDTGTAATVCGLLWAIAAWSRGYAPGPRAIGFAGNERGQRAAVILEKP